MTKVADFSCKSAVTWLESLVPIWSIQAYMASGNENLNIDKEGPLLSSLRPIDVK